MKKLALRAETYPVLKGKPPEGKLAIDQAAIHPGGDLRDGRMV